MFPELITELLQDGYKVNFSAPGHSMFPTIMANETIMVEPIDASEAALGDIILYRSNGNLIAHRVVGIDTLADNTSSSPSDPETQCSVPSPSQFFTFRGDAAAACDEPVKASQILGKVIAIERYGCSISPYSSTHKLSCLALFWMARIKRLPRIIFSIFSFDGR